MNFQLISNARFKSDWRSLFCWFLSLSFLSVSGCGTTISRTATEQLLTSDAVDRSVASIDFRALSGKTVYFDTQFIKQVKGVGFVNADYIVSSLRQQMVAADCLLQERREDADYIVEARVGALGSDNHEVSYGIPASNLMSTASTIVPTMPALPPLPELSFAKKNNQFATAKIGVFAYNSKTKHPVWQSGISQSKSTSKDSWILGMGPFQRGTIHEGTRFAGSKIAFPFVGSDENSDENLNATGLVAYDKEFRFRETWSDDSQTEQKRDSSNKKTTADSKPTSDGPIEFSSAIQEAPGEVRIIDGNRSDSVYLIPDEMKLFSNRTEYLTSGLATDSAETSSGESRVSPQ